MNQCVPSWDLDENGGPSPKLNIRPHHTSSNPLLPDHVPSWDYEVAELTWENGQLAMHGLGLPRVLNKPILSSSPAKYATWDKPGAGGTLESIVDQATTKAAADGDNADELVPWFNDHSAIANKAGSNSITVDALVPNSNSNFHPNDHTQDHSTRVGSCSCVVAARNGSGGWAPRGVARAGMCTSKINGSANESATCVGGRDSRQVTLDTYERELGGAGFTSTSLMSLGNTSSGREYTKTSGDDYDSFCHSRAQREAGEDEGKSKGSGKSSGSTKRLRAAAIHNQSERKRRDKINQRMKTLQKMVPNASKTDKASMLDEVIEYLKQLQAQVQMIGRMNMSPMMLPLAMQQQLQMSMMAPIGMGMGMGMGMGHVPGMPPFIPPPTAFMPVASWDNPGDHFVAPSASLTPDPLSAFLACQSQPMTMDGYSRLAALYQQFQQAPGSGSKN